MQATTDSSKRISRVSGPSPVAHPPLMIDEIISSSPLRFKDRTRTDVSLDSGDALRRRGHNKEGKRKKGREGEAGIKREHRATISFRHGAQIPRDTMGGVVCERARSRSEFSYRREHFENLLVTY